MHNVHRNAWVHMQGSRAVLPGGDRGLAAVAGRDFHCATSDSAMNTFSHDKHWNSAIVLSVCATCLSGMEIGHVQYSKGAEGDIGRHASITMDNASNSMEHCNANFDRMLYATIQQHWK